MLYFLSIDPFILLLVSVSLDLPSYALDSFPHLFSSTNPYSLPFTPLLLVYHRRGCELVTVPLNLFFALAPPADPLCRCKHVDQYLYNFSLFSPPYK